MKKYRIQRSTGKSWLVGRLGLTLAEAAKTYDWDRLVLNEDNTVAFRCVAEGDDDGRRYFGLQRPNGTAVTRYYY